MAEWDGVCVVIGALGRALCSKGPSSQTKESLIAQTAEPVELLR